MTGRRILTVSLMAIVVAAFLLPSGSMGVGQAQERSMVTGVGRTQASATAPWAMFRHDPQHTGRSPYVGPREGTVLWTFETGGEVHSSPAVDENGIVYVGSEDGKLYAVSASGSLRWSYLTGGGIYSSPAVGADGTLYVGSRDGNLYAINPDGSLQWSFPTGGEVNSSPTIGNGGTIYVGSYDGKLYALNPDGSEQCSYSAGGVILASPAIGPDGVIYVGSGNQNRLHAINPACTLKWQSDPPNANVLNSSPAVSPDGLTVYYGADDGHLYARNTGDGSLKWQSPYTYGGVQSSPAVGSDGTVYVGTQYGYLWALDADDGSIIWEQYTTLSAGSSPAIDVEGTIYFATDYGAIFARNPDGTEKWTFNGGGHFHSSPAIGRAGTLYIGSSNGKVYAFGTAPAWPMFHHDAQHTGRSPYVGPQQNTVAWTYRIGSEVSSSPAIGQDGTIYVGSENHKLYAMAPDGSVVWAFATGGGIYSSPALAGDGTIYVGSRDHNLYAITPDGALSWTFSTGGEVNSSPTVGNDGTIYVGSYDGTLYAISPAGDLVCSYPAGAVIHSSAAIGPDGVLYFGSANGRMNALYPDCTVKWSQVVTTNGVWTNPALSPDGSTVYYGADDGHLYATDTLSGTLKWESPHTYGGVQSSPAVGSDGTVYVGTQWGNLWALDPADGSPKWDYYMTLSVLSSPAIGADGTIYFATYYGYLYAMNPDGTVKWTYTGGYDAAGDFHSSPAIGSNGALYIGSSTGKLFAFNAVPPACGPQIGPWLQTATLPTPSGTTGARGQPLVVYNGRVYVFGGVNDTDGQLTNVYYSTINADGSLGPWIETTSLPGQYFDQVVVRVGKHVYLITGADGAIAVFYAPINADGTLGAWVRTADLVPSRQEYAVAAHGEYIYVVAGNSAGLTDRVWFTSAKPDGSLNPWADTTPLPEAMQAHTMVAHDGYLYVFAPNSTVYSAAIQADGTVGAWGTTTSLPQAMSAYTTFEHRDHVYLLGEPSQAVHYAPLLADSSLGQWQTTVALPEQRNRLRAGGNNCFVYAIGGYDGSHFRDTVTYARLQAPCEPISSVQLSRTPSGELFTGNAIHFTADANGTVPFTYTWTLDGAPAGANLSTFEHTFDTAGLYAVGVTVTNACGQGNGVMAVEVQELDAEDPKLFGSSKSANLTSVESGDTLTYTIWLRNSSSTAAAATLTDPIPVHTAYISGTAQASDGGPVTFASGQLEWSGQVISGTPVMVSFAVEVQAAAVGTPITNIAYLDDGVGHVIELRAGSIYNPGFGLTINDGALYTSIPTVTLSYSWNAANDITHIKISNDGGFGPGGNTTAWLPVDPGDPVYTDWVLATYGNLVLPRTVYVKFRDDSGQQYGPVQDEIIYDPDPPQVGGVEIIPLAARSADTTQAQNVIVRVTASDANSGVGRVQLSLDEGFGQFSEFTFTGPATDIPWTLQPSDRVYVRAVDRAGNLSEVVGEEGPLSKIYLPFVVRSAGGQ